MEMRFDPVIITGAGHSGTRGLIAALAAVEGVYLGDIDNVFKEWNFYRLLARNVNAWLFSLPEVHDNNVIPPDVVHHFRASERQRLECAARILNEIRDHPEISLPPAGTRWWVFKTPRTTLCLEIWRAVFPEAKFVNLVRDGRDVAVANWSPPAGAVARKFELWRARVNRIWRYQREGMPIIDFRYEDLPDPVKLRAFCEAVGLPYSPRMHDRLEMNVGKGPERMKAMPYDRFELMRYGYAPHFEHLDSSSTA
jgi:sulfotransferase family protein